MADNQNYNDESGPADEFPEPPLPDHEPPIEPPSQDSPPLEPEEPPLEDIPEEPPQEDFVGSSSMPYADDEVIPEQEPSIEKVSPSKIPLNVRFEIGRVNVSLEELQNMNPGYKLPIDINPRIVDLTVQGKSIGKGELIEIGETVGVKVVELY